MEQYYYNHMNKAQQAAYHSILSGVKNLADEFQIPALEGEELYNVFFQMRLDHPEIFWVSSYKYRYYKDSPNLIFIPEYLFDKKKICEHQKAMTARVEKLIRPAQKLSEWEKEKYVHDFICENIRYDKLKKSYSHEIIGPLGQGVGVCEGRPKLASDLEGITWGDVGKKNSAKIKLKNWINSIRTNNQKKVEGFKITDLNDAFQITLKNQKIKKLRIFAISTFKSVQMFRLINDISINHAEILLRLK